MLDRRHGVLETLVLSADLLKGVMRMDITLKAVKCKETRRMRVLKELTSQKFRKTMF